MQNLARFRSTLKFGGEYLQNGWRYSKSVSYTIDSDSSRVRRNKSSDVWSNNLGDLDVDYCTHPKGIFRKTIFRPLRDAAPPNTACIFSTPNCSHRVLVRNCDNLNSLLAFPLAVRSMYSNVWRLSYDEKFRLQLGRPHIVWAVGTHL